MGLRGVIKERRGKEDGRSVSRAIGGEMCSGSTFNNVTRFKIRLFEIDIKYENIKRRSRRRKPLKLTKGQSSGDSIRYSSKGGKMRHTKVRYISVLRTVSCFENEKIEEAAAHLIINLSSTINYISKSSK